MERIYLDHAATTPMDQRIVDKMMPYFTEILAIPLVFIHMGARQESGSMKQEK